MDLTPVLERVLPHVSDVAGGALLYFLVLDAKRLMPGVAELTAGRLDSSRYAYAARWILDELSAAPECSRDAYSGHLIAWPVIDTLAAAPQQARAWAQRLAALGATWTPEAAARLTRRLTGASSKAFADAWKAAAKAPRSRAPAPPVPDRVDPLLRELKLLERQLRGDFPDRSDLGDRPSADERLLLIRAFGLGFTAADVGRALRGRAAACRRSPTWKGEDTIEGFLRLTWLLGGADRIQRALSERLDVEVEEVGLVVGEGGKRWVAGMEVVDRTGEEAPPPIVMGDDGADTLALLRSVGRMDRT
jgi:hypothetical protein